MDADGPVATSTTGNTSTSPTAESSNVSGGIQKVKKRTKTGCLTCRRRRIKCGEERPTCANCIKSKRACEGYNQRVVWKQPMDHWSGLAEDAPTLQYHTGTLPPSMGQYRNSIPPPIDTAFQSMQTRDGQTFYVDQNGQRIFSPPDSGMPFTPMASMMPMESPSAPFPHGWTPTTSQQSMGMYGQVPATGAQFNNVPGHFPVVQQQINSHMAPPYGADLSLDQTFGQPSQMADLSTPDSVYDSKPSYMEHNIQNNYSTASYTPVPQLDGPVCWWDPTGGTTSTVGYGDVSWATGSVQHATTTGPDLGASSLLTASAAQDPQTALFVGGNIAGVTASFLEDAAVEYQDDDYFDVQSDDELDITPEETLRQLQQENRDLSLIQRLHQEHLNELSLRRYDTFLESGMMDHYRAEEKANPLRNGKTARVFAHFIFATGPSLSIFERNTRDPSAMFSGSSSDYQQGLWTYTLPMMAIKHQGLLHAMLALSSLHISKLQGTSSMPSYKHYSYAIKRIHKSVEVRSKRLQPTTIAATLLLGFYEVLTADHMKWSSHLAGAKQLFLHIPFKRMTKDARRLKAQQLATRDFFNENQAAHTHGHGSDVNENLVAVLMGRSLRRDQYGQILGDDETGEDDFESSSASEAFDLKKYELYQDLFWWYARQDAYAAILSGNKLLLDYSKWSDCPPRAGMGRPDAVFGAHDHLILLLARIADFIARDRSRKIKAMEANGGQWRPPSTMGGPPPNTHPPRGQPPTSHMHGHPSVAANVTGGHHTFNQPAVTGAAFGELGQAYKPTSQFPSGMGSSQEHIGRGQIPSNASTGYSQPLSFNQASPNAPFATQAGMGQAPPPPRGPSAGPPPGMPQFYGMAPLPTTINMPPSYAVGSNLPQSSPSPGSVKSELDLDEWTNAALKEWSEIRSALNTFESHLGPHFQPLPSDVHMPTHMPTMTPFGPALFYRSHDIAIIWALYYMAIIITQRCHPYMPPAAMMAQGVAAAQTKSFAIRIGQVIGGIVPLSMGPDLTPNLGACLCEASLPLFFAGVQYGDADQRQWLVTLLRNVELRTGWKSVGMVAQGCETAWEKAGEMGRGPPYKRMLDQWHLETARDSRVARITGNYTALDQEDSDQASVVNPGTRVHWAMGLLSLEEEGDERRSRHVSGLQPSHPLKPQMQGFAQQNPL